MKPSPLDYEDSPEETDGESGAAARRRLVVALLIGLAVLVPVSLWQIHAGRLGLPWEAHHGIVHWLNSWVGHDRSHFWLALALQDLLAVVVLVIGARRRRA